jgi:hypothetical protein
MKPTVSDEAPPPIQWRGPLLSSDAAAARLGLAKQTMAAHRVRGIGCPYLKISSRIFYYADELDAWIAANRRSSTSDRSAVITP